MSQLQAPKEYWSLSQKERLTLLNQCGPEGPLNGLIPDSLLGLDISESCNIHDFMVMKARNRNHLKVADDVFHRNMRSQIKVKPGFKGVWRQFLAYIYFKSVRVYSWLKSKNEKKLDSVK